MIRSRLYAGLCALSLSVGVAGCDDKGKDVAGGATGDKAKAIAKAVANAPEFLKLIPADSPYVFTNFEAVPKPVLDKLFKALEPMLAEAEKALAAELANAPTDDVEGKLMRAVLEELKGNLNQAGLEKLGFGTEPKFAIYGIGLMPALRITLKDGAALKAAVGRVEAKAGQKAPTKKLGEIEYYAISEDGVTVAIAIHNNELLVTGAPDAIADKVIGMLFGTEKPAKSMADANTLQDAMGKYGFAPYGVGIIDVRVISDTLMGKATGINADVWSALKAQAGMPDLSADCQAEIGGMVAKAPRMVFGYDKFTETELGAQYIIEMDGGLAKELSDLRAPVPGLAAIPAGSPLLAFGAGLDIAKTIEFAKGKAKAIQAAPFKCELLGDLNQSASEMATQMDAAPVPPFITGVRGFYVVVKDASLENGVGPEALGSVKAYGVVSTEKPEELVTMLKGMVPPLAALEVKADGNPVALPAGLAPVPSAHVAMNDKTIGISVGDGMQTELPATLTAKAGDDPPLLAFSYDVGRIMKAMNDQMVKSMAQMPPEMQADMQRTQAMNQAVAGMLGVTSYSVHMNDKGVVIKQNIKLP